MAKRRKRAKRGSAIIQCTPNKFGPPTYSTRLTEKVDGKARRVFITLKAMTPEDAELEVMDIQKRIKQGLPAVAPTVEKAPATTITALVEDFCDSYQSDAVWDIKRRRADLRSVLGKHLVPFLGTADPETIRVEDINLFKDALAEAGRTDSRKRRVLIDTQLMFTWAMSRGKLKRADNPWERIDKPALESSTEFYSEDEVSALLDWCERHGKHELHALIAFAFYTGCRRGEIAAARWADVDHANNRITISRSWKREARKAGDALTVNLNPHLLAILKAHRARLGMIGDGLIFPSSKTDKHKQRTRMRTMNTLWGLDDAVVGVTKDAVNQAPNQTAPVRVRSFDDPWHAFRHAHGTALAVRNASLSTIQAALGQKTESMARRYTHMASTAAKAYVDALPVLGKVIPMSDVRQQVGSGETTAARDRSNPLGETATPTVS